jgi:hypothetical protein
LERRPKIAIKLSGSWSSSNFQLPATTRKSQHVCVDIFIYCEECLWNYPSKTGTMVMAMLTYLVCLLSFAARFVSAHQQHLRTVPLSSTGKEEDNSLHRSTITCPSRENDTVSDALDLISRNYLTAPWLEGGVMTLNDFEWTTITTSLGGFTTPNVFISLPKLPGTVSNEGVSAMPRVKTVSFLTVNGEVGHATFQAKLYQANSTLCSKEWRIPTTLAPVTVTWMVANTGAYNITGRVFFVNQGPITREDWNPENNNNRVRINHL